MTTDSVKVFFSTSKEKLTFDKAVISIKEIEEASQTLGYKVER